MRSERLQRYDFRTVAEEDFSMLRGWLAEPHMAQWWKPVEQSIANIRAAMESVETEPLIVELDGKPIAYLQCYDPHLEDGHPYQDQPFGTLGLDISIGPADFLGKGHGSAIISQFAEQLFDEGAPRVIIDPHPGNLRAIRAYEKAGFTAFDTRTTVYGPALMMKRDAPQEN
jgi:aminoglycoside 6'-N-acetyltransferase